MLLSTQAAPATKPVERTRKLVFANTFSCGKLYSMPRKALPDWLSIAADATRIGRSLGEARGIVEVPAEEQIYLQASYDLVAHPEGLARINRDDLACISFGKIGLLAPVENVIPYISRLTGLRRLEIEAGEMPDERLESLKTLVNLEALDLTVCSVKGAFFAKLNALSRLKELNLSDNSLVPQCYPFIGKLHSLVYLDLSHCGVKDNDLAALEQLKNLQHLSLARSLVTRKGLAQLKKIPSLLELALSDCNLSVEDLCALKGVGLHQLYLPKSDYSEAQLRKLHQALPRTDLVGLRRGNKMDPNTFFAPLH
jgi:hypothetical protein